MPIRYIVRGSKPHMIYDLLKSSDGRVAFEDLKKGTGLDLLALHGAISGMYPAVVEKKVEEKRVIEICEGYEFEVVETRTEARLRGQKESEKLLESNL